MEAVKRKGKGDSMEGGEGERKEDGGESDLLKNRRKAKVWISAPYAEFIIRDEPASELLKSRRFAPEAAEEAMIGGVRGWGRGRRRI